MQLVRELEHILYGSVLKVQSNLPHVLHTAGASSVKGESLARLHNSVRIIGLSCHEFVHTFGFILCIYQMLMHCICSRDSLRGSFPMGEILLNRPYLGIKCPGPSTGVLFKRANTLGERPNLTTTDFHSKDLYYTGMKGSVFCRRQYK